MINFVKNLLKIFVFDFGSFVLGAIGLLFIEFEITPTNAIIWLVVSRIVFLMITTLITELKNARINFNSWDYRKREREGK